MDEQLFFIINGSHTPFFDQLMYLISGKAVWLPLYIALLYVVWRNYSWRGIITVLMMVGIGMLITDTFNSQLLRPWIGRLRPSNPDNPIAPLVHIVNDRHGHGCGMPSAHSSNTWMLTLLMIYWLRSRWTYITMPLVTIAVCYSRIYLGFHYPGDILGGFLLAAIAVALLVYVHRTICKSSKGIVLSQVKSTTARQAWVPTLIAALTFIAFAIAAALQV